MGKHKRARDLAVIGAYFRAHPEERDLGPIRAVDETKPAAIPPATVSEDRKVEHK